MIFVIKRFAQPGDINWRVTGPLYTLCRYFFGGRTNCLGIEDAAFIGFHREVLPTIPSGNDASFPSGIVVRYFLLNVRIDESQRTKTLMNERLDIRSGYRSPYWKVARTHFRAEN